MWRRALQGQERELLELVILGSLLDPLPTELASPGTLTTHRLSYNPHCDDEFKSCLSSPESSLPPVFLLRFFRQQFSL